MLGVRGGLGWGGGSGECWGWAGGAWEGSWPWVWGRVVGGDSGLSGRSGQGCWVWAKLGGKGNPRLEGGGWMWSGAGRGGLGWEVGTSERVAKESSRDVSWLFSWLRSRPDTLVMPRPRSSWLALVESVSMLKSGTEETKKQKNNECFRNHTCTYYEIEVYRLALRKTNLN